MLGELGDLGDGLEVAFGRNRESGFDDVDAHLVEEFGDLQFLLERHGGAGALLAVAQRRVEDHDVVVGTGSVVLELAVMDFASLWGGTLASSPRNRVWPLVRLIP